MTFTAVLGVLATPVARAESSIEIISQENPIEEGGGWLGVRIQDVDASLAEALDLGRTQGVLVSDVVAGSPAELGGLRSRDVILKLGSDAVVDTRQLTHLIREHRPGAEVYLAVWRDGEQLKLRVDLGEAPARPLQPKAKTQAFRFHAPPLPDTLMTAPPPPPRLGSPGRVRVSARGARLGVTVLSPDESLAKYFEVRPGQGVLVTGVQSGSAAEAAGLEAGDVILSVDDREVASPEALRTAIRERSGDELAIEFMRQGRRERAVAELPVARAHRAVRAEDPAQTLRRDWNRLRRDIRRHGPELARRELRNLKLEIEELRQDLRELRDEVREELEDK